MEVLADLVAALHLGYFLFVVAGSAALLVGARHGRAWIYNPLCRIGHLSAVLLILAEDVFHFPCALNVLETDLRATAASTARQPGAVSGVLDLLLRHTIPGRLLDSMYWILGVLLWLLIVLLPPRFRSRVLSG